MAVQTPPFVLQNGSHGSELVRREALASLTYGSAGGVVPATPAASASVTAGLTGCSDLKVNAPGSGMSVLINPGQCYVPGSLGSGAGYGIGVGYGMPTVTLNGAAAPTIAANAKATQVQLTTQGIYYCYNDNSTGQVSLTVAASNASNPRIDVVIAQVEDSQYSGANNDWKLAVVTGTPAASPTVPALPANSLALAYVWVPAASNSVTAGNILDLRVAANRNPFRAAMYRNSALTLTASAVTLTPLDSVLFDPAGMCAAPTVTVPVSGLWWVGSSIALSTSTDGTRLYNQINHNGAAETQFDITNGAANSMTCSISTIVQANAGDTLNYSYFVSVAETIFTGQNNVFLRTALLSPL